MPLILNIDTAIQSASICLADGEKIIDTMINPSDRESASWLHVAIQELLQRNNIHLKQLDAIAISAGPGSYTGLRVGMAAAKGLCYPFSLPLIAVNTLQMMTAALSSPSTQLLCPMIDARRMEVFTALFNADLQEIMSPTNMIFDESSFAPWLEKNTISFFGNGSEKAKQVIRHPNARFESVIATAANMIGLSTKKYKERQFSDLAYSEPFYGKDFHSPHSKKNY